MGPQCASDRRLRFIKGTFYPSPKREGRARRTSVGGPEPAIAFTRETAGSSVRSTCAMGKKKEKDFLEVNKKRFLGPLWKNHFFCSWPKMKHVK